MLDYFKKIWKDPVLSKVISAGLIALIILAYNLFIAIIDKTPFKTVFINFWTAKFELWQIIIAAILVVLLYLLTNKLRNFKYDNETLKLDRKLFDQIREVHLTEDMMLAPKNFSFSSNPFLGNLLLDLFKISEESKKSNFEFFNPILEEKKHKLIDELDNLYSVTSRYIFGTGNSGYLSIPSEWELTDPDRMDEAVSKISSQEKKLSDAYNDLIKTGRRVLKV